MCVVLIFAPLMWIGVQWFTTWIVSLLLGRCVSAELRVYLSSPSIRPLAFLVALSPASSVLLARYVPRSFFVLSSQGLELGLPIGILLCTAVAGCWLSWSRSDKTNRFAYAVRVGICLAVLNAVLSAYFSS